MTADRIRVGVVGANVNSWAARSHLPAIQALHELELAAVCTTRMESARESAERFDDHRDMLDRGDVDVVAVSVRAPKHYRITMDALQAGKHVYTEWPLGANLREAEEMADLAREKGVKTMVGLQERRAPLYLRLKELVDEGYFGEVLSCYKANCAIPLRHDFTRQEKLGWPAENLWPYQLEAPRGARLKGTGSYPSPGLGSIWSAEFRRRLALSRACPTTANASTAAIVIMAQVERLGTGTTG